MKYAQGLVFCFSVSCGGTEKEEEIIPKEGVYLLSAIEVSDECQGHIGVPLEAGETRESTIYVNSPELTIDLNNCTWDGSVSICEDADVMKQGYFNDTTIWVSVSSRQDWTFDDSQSGEALLNYTYDCDDSDCPHLAQGISMTLPCTVSERVTFAWSGSSAQ